MVLLATFVAEAQQKKWTLQECVIYAVENNLTVAQFELDLENALIDKSDALGGLLPSLNANANASNNVGFSIVPGSNAPTTQTTFRSSGGLGSNWTLFDGLRNLNNMARAKMNALATQYRLEDLKDDIRLNVANAYLQVLSNKEALKVSQAQLEITLQDLKRTQELLRSGVVPKGDLLEIEATVASQEQQVVNNEAVVTIAKINLAQLLQITDYENFDTADESFEVPVSDILSNSAKDIYQKALSFRNDIKLAESNVQVAEKDIELARGAYYPTLTGFFNYNLGYSNRNQIPDQNNIPFVPSFIDQLWIFDGVSYGAQLNIPVFNGWSARNRVKRSKIALDRSKLQMEQTKLELETLVNQAYLDVTTFYKSYEAAQKTLGARQLAYDYAKDRYDVGLLNAFDYGQAQARVDNAQAQLIRTKYDYIFRLKILEFYFGIPVAVN